jgi:hypothetical protein
MDLKNMDDLREQFEANHMELFRIKKVEVYFRSQLEENDVLAGEIDDTDGELYFRFILLPENEAQKVGFVVTDHNGNYLNPLDGLGFVKDDQSHIFAEEVGLKFLKTFQ